MKHEVTDMKLAVKHIARTSEIMEEAWSGVSLWAIILYLRWRRFQRWAIE